MDDILYKLCVHNLNIMDGWHPLPATCLAEMLDISVGKVRYHLRKLKEQGLVESFHEGGITEDGELYCIWGWCITEKAHKTEEYKKAYEFERKLCIECFGWDCGMKEAKWLYRLESKSPDNGLWYDSNNNYVFGIGKLENCKTKDLPMGYDERYHAEGKNWFSSCSRKEDLAHWYSLEDAEWLIEHGFHFTMWLAVDYTEYENETVFLKETCLDMKEIDIKTIMEEGGHDG